MPQLLRVDHNINLLNLLPGKRERDGKQRLSLFDAVQIKLDHLLRRLPRPTFPGFRVPFFLQKSTQIGQNPIGEIANESGLSID